MKERMKNKVGKNEKERVKEKDWKHQWMKKNESMNEWRRMYCVFNTESG